MIVGKDVLDAIWDEEKARRLKDTVWSGISPSIGRPAFVVQKTWDNPYPDKTIQSLDSDLRKQRSNHRRVRDHPRMMAGG